MAEAQKTETGPALKIRCVIVTPERAVLDELVDFVALPLFDGELGVAPGRIPLIGRLGYGELRTVKGSVTERYFLDGGFVQVSHNVVTVLTARAIKAEDINLAKAVEALQASLTPTTTDEAMAAQAKAQQRARSQIHLAKKVADSKEIHITGLDA